MYDPFPERATLALEGLHVLLIFKSSSDTLGLEASPLTGSLKLAPHAYGGQETDPCNPAINEFPGGI